MDIKDIYEKAQSLIAQYCTADPFELSACMGLNVRYADLGSLKGMYKCIAGNYFIIINSALDEPLSRAVCCHELCHHILHSHIAGNIGIYETMLFDMSARTELEANMLASELMISDEDMRRLAEEGRSLEEIASITETDVHFVMLKAGLMKKRGYSFLGDFDIQSDFLGKIN